MSNSNEYISFDMNQECFRNISNQITFCNPDNPNEKLVFSSVDELLDFNRNIWKLKKQTEWQPIETAPKIPSELDEYGYMMEQFYPILLCIKGKNYAEIGGWISSKQKFYTLDSGFANFTHWQPLPKPPTYENQQSNS